MDKEDDVNDPGRIPSDPALDEEFTLEEAPPRTNGELEFEASEIPDEPAPKEVPSPGRRLSAGSSRIQRRTAAEQYKKTSKGPGKTGKRIKLALLAVVALGLPAGIALGFVLQDRKGDPVWIGLGRKAGLLKAAEEKPAPPLEAKPVKHPEQARFESIVRRTDEAERELSRLARLLRDTKTWSKDEALRARSDLDRARAGLEGVREDLEKFHAWYGPYLADRGAYDAASARGDKARIADLDRKLRRHEFLDVDIPKAFVKQIADKQAVLRRDLARLAGRYPRREEILAGKLPKRSAGRGPRRSAVEFSPALLNPYLSVGTGSWMRLEETKGDFLSESKALVDTVFKRAEKDHAILERFTFANGLESDPKDERVEFPRIEREETIKVGDEPRDCRVVRWTGERRWLWKAGPMSNRLPLRFETEEGTLTAKEVGEETIKVQGSDLACVYVRYEGTLGGKKTLRRAWYSERVPLWLVKEEIDIGDGERKVRRILVAFGPAPRPAFAKPKAPIKTKPPLVAPKIAHPWAAFSEGNWVRLKITSRQPGTTVVTWTDTILVAASETGRKFRTEAFLPLTGTIAKSERTEKRPSPAGKVVGEESIDVAGKSYRCVIVESGAGSRAWIPVAGPRVALKTAGPGGETRVVALGEQFLPVAQREVACLYVETDGPTGKGKTWYSEAIPGGVARMETESKVGEGVARTLVEVVGFGLGERPPFPKKTPEKEKVKEKSPAEWGTEGDAQSERGLPLLVEVLRARREGLPSDAAARKALQEKADAADTYLGKAIDAYKKAQAKEKVERLERLRVLLGQVRDHLRAQTKK